MIRQGRTASALLKEASALQQLHHPNIVRIFGCVCGWLSLCPTTHPLRMLHHTTSCKPCYLLDCARGT